VQGIWSAGTYGSRSPVAAWLYFYSPGFPFAPRGGGREHPRPGRSAGEKGGGSPATPPPRRRRPDGFFHDCIRPPAAFVPASLARRARWPASSLRAGVFPGLNWSMEEPPPRPWPPVPRPRRRLNLLSDSWTVSGRVAVSPSLSPSPGLVASAPHLSTKLTITPTRAPRYLRKRYWRPKSLREAARSRWRVSFCLQDTEGPHV
jgi:hypothetical protein